MSNRPAEFFPEIERCRQRAADFREKAKVAPSLHAREALEELADTFEQLAQSAETLEMLWAARPGQKH